MERELKISVTIFLVFAVFGLGSYFNTGSFVTAVFLNAPAVLVASIAFYLMNVKIERSWILGLLSLGFLSYALQDAFLGAFLIEKLKFYWLIGLLENDIFNGLTLFLFVLGMTLPVLELYRESKSLLSIIPGLMFAGVIVMFLAQSFIGATLFMMAFCLSYFAIAQRVTKDSPSIARICSAVFFLFTFLESVEFLQ